VRVFAASKFLLKSLLSERATGVVGALCFALLAVSFFLGDINIAVKHKLLEDALIASEGFIMTLIAILYAFFAMEKERKGGIFVFILVSGASRAAYLLSQFIALFGAVLFLFALFLVVDFVFLEVFAGSFGVGFLMRLLYLTLSSAMLAFLTLTLARYVSNTNAVIYSILLFFIGNGADELVLYAKGTSAPFSYFIYYVLPNFSFFDPLALSAEEPFVFLYFALYSSLLFVVALFKFKKEALRVG